jgi:hypothetical protein
MKNIKDNSLEVGNQVKAELRLKHFHDKCVRNCIQKCGREVTSLECITCNRGWFYEKK